MVIKLTESGVSWQSTHVLNAAKLVQNPPDREINMKLVERSYLRRQRKAAIEDFARNATTLRRTKYCERQLLWPVFHVWGS